MSRSNDHSIPNPWGSEGRKPGGIALYREPHFTFRFEGDRVVSRFHLEGIEAGRRVGVFKLDDSSHLRPGRITAATVGAGGWVDVAEPILVRAGEGFVVVPEGQTRIGPWPSA